MSELDLSNNKKERKKWQIWKLTNSEVAERRASLRLSEIPEAKRPYYGPNNSKGNSKEEVDIVTPQRLRILNNSEVAKRRASLRSSEVPEAKRPYYGPNPQSSPPFNKYNRENITEEEDIVTPQQLRVPNNSEVAKRRASLRLSEIPEAKRPYYGPNNSKENSKEEVDIVTPQQLRVPNNYEVAKRGASLRSSEVPEAKRPYYGPNPQSSPSTEDDIITPQPLRVRVLNDSAVAKKRASLRSSEVPDAKRHYYGPNPQSPPLTNKRENNKEEDQEGIITTPTSMRVSTNQLQQQSSISTMFSYVPHSADDIAKVKSTLRIYNKHYLHFVQDENARDNVFVKRHKKKTGLEKKQVKRPDLIATTHMRNSNEILFPKKRLGHLPGIDVGCHFYSRAEMVAVGIHSHWLYGIDYMGKEYSKMEEFKGYKFPLAVAIVCSGQYEDDEDNREEIEYTGQGGNDFHGTKRQIKNQEMSPGNLALKNCMEQSIPVRFIRGIPGDKRFHGDTRFKLYTYDGLYTVDSYQLDVGKSGFAVYKFRLKRLGGQPKLTSNKVQYNKYNSRRMRISSVPKLVSLDITGGQENLPIPVINTIDDTTITGFTYTKSIQVPPGMKLPPNAPGCKCNGSCRNSKTCACAKLNGGDFPYVQDSGGRLIEAKDVVFECGPNCGCGPGCINRISQREIKYQLEVFRTSDRGWAVKTKDFIPSGAPICEYIGQLRRQREMDKVDNNEYIFEIDCEQTIKEIGGRERRLGAGSAKSENVAVDEKESEPEFCIEAGSVGNVARFINHSCDPNLFVQCVVSSHHDLRLARIILFASDNIPPNQELAYDYGYALDSVVDENGNVQKLTCHCGTSLCRGRLY